MSKSAHHELGWEVLAQPTGEVLAAEARSPGLMLGLLGVPEGFDARDAEGWLYDVAGVSHESAASRPASRPIPVLLDHAITGLLFSHAELWEQPGSAAPCSFAFVEGRGEIGFGWVGEAKVSVWVDGEPRAKGFITLRDARGRTGRAWSFPSYHNVQVRISWCGSTHPGSGGAEVEASWIADGRSAPGYEPVPAHGEWAMVSRSDAGALEPEGEAVMAEAETSASRAAGAEDPPTLELVPLAVAEADRPVVKPRHGFWAWLRGLFGFAGHDEPEVDEEEVWRAAAEESVDVVATGTDDAIGFSYEAGSSAASAGPSLQLAERTQTGSQQEVSGTEIGASRLDESAVTASEAGAPARFEPADAGIDPVDPPAHEPATGTIGAELVSAAAAPEPVSGDHDPPAGLPPDLETGDLAERAAQPSVAEDPHAIELPSFEPAARLARLEESMRHDVPELKLVGITPEESEASSSPASRGIVEAFPSALGHDPEPVPTGTEGEALVPSPAPSAAAALPPSWSAITPQHPAWPSPQELARSRRSPLRHLWRWLALVAALFAGGWLVGGLQDDGRPRDASRRGALGDALHAVGLGGPRYLVQVNSRPPGAWIAVDGQPLALRTPAAIEAAPGAHIIGLSFSEYGSASFRVEGRKSDRVPLDAVLWGALEVISPDEVGVIGVKVDGVPHGFAPLRVDSLAPGVHELGFSGPGMEPWGQTVEIRVRETRELLARAVQSPSSGVLEVQASLTDEAGSQPLKGALVYVDGESRGVTPLTLDLPRGPHSVRLVYKGQEPPVQVIDLPGGNQRFAVFELGVETDAPRLTVDVPARIPRERPAVLSATVVGIAPAELREMWLHVQMPDGAWRRYEMTMLRASAGAAGVVTFPVAAFDAQGRARYYVSAQSGQGDETFTEMRSISIESGPAH